MINTETTDTSRRFKTVTVDAEIVVIGAGIAGITAALTAARQGRSTVLVTDRPILGGSASSEIRVGPCGAAAPPFNRFSRETGIIEEIFNHLHKMAHNAGKWRWFYFDQIYFDLVLGQENLKIYLNTSIFEAMKTDDGLIGSLKGLQLRAETIYEFNGRFFIDCTGDGTIGFLSGAHYRIGREGKPEFNEVYSPTEPDSKTMGSTLLFTTVDTGHDVDFETPSWAVDIKELESIGRINRSIHNMPDGSYYGFWWVEYGGLIDSIHDDGEIILHLRKVVNGLWGHIKNSGKFPDSKTQEINWIGFLPGKRESRRLIGPYIVNANDLTKQKNFDDAIGYTGWPIDIHPPEGYLTNEPGCTHDYLPGITDIPYRCIYSKNIENLFFAGRHISSTHEALGTLRVISTTSVMGQAAGMAAAMCLDKNVNQSEILEEHINELQEKLLRTDQSIIGMKLMEKRDFSRNSIVSASSEKSAELVLPEDYRYLGKSMGIILPIENRLDSISLLMESDAAREVTVDVYSTDGIKQNYRVKDILKSITVSVDKKDWYEFKVGNSQSIGDKLFIMARKNPGVKIYMQKERLTGVLGIESEDDVLGYHTIYKPLGHIESTSMTPCFKTYPEQRLYRPEMINNGYIRPCAMPNTWMSDYVKPGKPEYIQLTFESEKLISNIEVIFNSNLNPRRITANINQINSEMVKGYELIAITNNGEVTLAVETENFKRFMKHSFKSLKAKGIILRIHETWGSPFAEVFDLRVY